MNYTSLDTSAGTGALLGGLFAVSGIIIVVALAIIVAAYIVQSLAIKKALTFYGYDKTWAAWIPVYQTMCLVDCIDADADGMITIFGKLFKRDYFKWYPVASVLIGFLGFPGIITTVINMVLNFVLYKHLYEQKSGKDETGLAVASAFIPLIWIIMCFTRFKGER